MVSVIKIDVYERSFLLVYGGKKTWKKEMKKAGIWGQVSKQIMHEKCDGCCVTNETEAYMFLSKGVSSGVIAHESFHMVARLNDSIGGYLDSSSEENWAYMIGYIVDQVNGEIKKRE